MSQHDTLTQASLKDAVFQAAIDFISTLTGMTPLPIEVAPPEVFRPFRDFTDKVCAIFDAQPAQASPRLIGWRTDDYLMETSDKAKAENWAPHLTILPIFEGDPHTKLQASAAQPAQAAQLDAASEAFSAMAAGVPVDAGWVKAQAAQGAGEVVAWALMDGDDVKNLIGRKRVAEILLKAGDEVRPLTYADAQPAVAQGAGEVVSDYYPELLIARSAVQELEQKVFSLEQCKAILQASVASYQRDMVDPPAYLQDAVIKAAGLGAMAEQIAALKKQVGITQPAAGADVLDAERYRWLRKDRPVLLLTAFFGNGCINKTLEQVDATIDAAIAASGRQE